MITFACSCGQLLQVHDAHAGATLRCPQCRAVATAPQGDVRDAIVERPPSRYARFATAEPEDLDQARVRRARPATSGKALGGMILGLATFVLPVVCAIPAIILSILGLIDIKRNPGRLAGTGLAVTGIIAALLGNVSILGYAGMYSVLRAGHERAQLQSNMMQLGVAMHIYHDANGTLPPAEVGGKAGVGLSWRVALLPYIEQAHLYKQFKLDEPWDSPNNIKLLPMMPKLYAPLGRQPAGPNMTYMQVFTGAQAPFRNNKGMRLVEFVDGTSNTILIAEASDAVPWTKPADIAFNNMKGPLPRLGAVDSSRFMALMADGSVRFVRRGTNDAGLRLAICPDDMQMLPVDWDLGR